MARTILLVIYAVVWGAAVIILAIKKGDVPPEYWTLPAIGIGGLLAALDMADRRRDRRGDPDAEGGQAEEN